MNTPHKLKIGNTTLFKQAKSPFWNLRVMIRGRRRQFSTGESTKALAEDKARSILVDLKSRGLAEAITLHSRRVDQTPTDPTIDEFARLYEQVIACGDYPPAHQTQQRYLKSLKFLCAEIRVVRIRSLTPEKVRAFIAAYQDRRTRDGRFPDNHHLMRKPPPSHHRGTTRSPPSHHIMLLPMRLPYCFLVMHPHMLERALPTKSQSSRKESGAHTAKRHRSMEHRRWKRSTNSSKACSRAVNVSRQIGLLISAQTLAGLRRTGAFRSLAM